MECFWCTFKKSVWISSLLAAMIRYPSLLRQIMVCSLLDLREINRVLSFADCLYTIGFRYFQAWKIVIDKRRAVELQQYSAVRLRLRA